MPLFYFLEEKKFKCQLNKILKLRTRNDFRIKAVIQQVFLPHGVLKKLC